MPAPTLRPARRILAGLAATTLCLVAVSACGSDDEDGAATPPAPVASAATGAGEPTATTADAPSTTVTVTVQDGKVAPAPTTVTVKAGDVVRIVATSDQKDTVHVHGIDLELPLDAGVANTLTFTAQPAGSYEVETHESDLLLFKLDVTS